jgi:photosystem II stability/assembly factor-like uncharacterized protein
MTRCQRIATRYLLLSLLIAVGVVSAQSQEGWVPTQVGPPGTDLNTIFFLDNNRGWIGGDGGFVTRTDDGGRSWVQEIMGTSNAVNDIYFRNRDDGFLLAGNAIWATHDGGVSWSEIRRIRPAEFEGDVVELYSVRFSGKKKGWVVGSASRNDTVVSSLLVYTDDAGETWQRQRPPSRSELIHVDFVDEKRGWIAGASGTIMRTEDGGQTWTKQDSGTDATVFHIDFRNKEKGWAVGERGLILRTTDGGHTWLPAASPTRATLLSVQFVSEDQGWIVGRGGVVMRSDDGGRTWIEQENRGRQNLYALYMNKKAGWAVGGDGILLHYDR